MGRPVFQGDEGQESEPSQYCRWMDPHAIGSDDVAPPGNQAENRENKPQT